MAQLVKMELEKTIKNRMILAISIIIIFSALACNRFYLDYIDGNIVDNLQVWANINNTRVSSVLMAVMIIVALGNIFSEEYAINAAELILSTKESKRKLVIAKILAGLAFATIMFMIISLIFILNGVATSFALGDDSLSSLIGNKGYNMTIIKGSALGYLLNFAGVLGFSLVVMLVSLMLKNNMTSVVTSLVIYFLPSLIALLNIDVAFLKNLRAISFMSLFSGIYIFGSDTTYEILGITFCIPCILIIALILIVIISIYFLRTFGKNQNI